MHAACGSNLYETQKKRNSPNLARFDVFILTKRKFVSFIYNEVQCMAKKEKTQELNYLAVEQSFSLALVHFSAMKLNIINANKLFC